MPTHKQTTVESVVTTRATGKADTATLSGIYSASPIHSGDLTAEGVQKHFQENVLDGVTNDAGHTFGELNKDYSGSPDLEKVATGGGGLPASPYVPNPTSPGPGSLDATKQVEAPDGFGQTPSDTWGSGVGSQLNPATSSAAISKQTLGDYGFGKSS